MRTIAGIRIEMIERGAGRPLLFLHPGMGIAPDAPVLELLAKHTRLIAPTHPGFGASDLPAGFDHIDDLAYFYLDLLDELDLADVTVVGISFGAWIAAEMAIKAPVRMSRLILANAVGIKVGDREARDIVDFFALTEDELNKLAYFDPRVGARDYKTMPEPAVRALARNREAMARFGWSPFMHDPKLRHRLRRIRIPSLLLWGTADRMLAPGYAEAYCAAIPGARLQKIERAGHSPHIEQPEEFARHVLAFVEETAR
jgi:pimeloyl-ACP methyl ester carboxylesterase